MQTQILTVDPHHPQPSAIARAASVLLSGGLVAMPTETVYGLGAHALDAQAVERIFEAKGRPATNPIIVHVADLAAARELVLDWPSMAQQLAERFWPGPLTLVLRKRAVVPDIVTAGGATIALRVPAHPVALALIRAAGVPVAAPSANTSTRVSPTRAQDVLRTLDGRIEMLLNGGPTSGGLESTVLDLTSSPPVILRPGLVTPEQLEEVIGRVSIGPTARAVVAPLRSPGLMARHYAPRAALELMAADPLSHAQVLAGKGLKVGVLTMRQQSSTDSVGRASAERVHVIAMPSSAATYAACLYAVLHDLDALGVDRIVVEMPPDEPQWLAVRDRLLRAATS